MGCEDRIVATTYIKEREKTKQNKTKTKTKIRKLAK